MACHSRRRESTGGFPLPCSSSSLPSYSPQSHGYQNLQGKVHSLEKLSAANHQNRWLIAHEHEDEAFKIMGDLENKSEDDPFIIAQHKEIVYGVQYERQNAVPWSQLLRGKTGGKGGTKTMRRLFLGMGTQAIQQLAGIKYVSNHPHHIESTNTYKCHILLFANSLDRVCGLVQQHGSPARCLQQCVIPCIQSHSGTKCRTLGPAKTVDVRGCWTMLLLRDHYSTAEV